LIQTASTGEAESSAPAARKPFKICYKQANIFKVVPVGDAGLTVGSHVENDIALLDPCVSSKHCVFLWKEDLLCVSDLQSRYASALLRTHAD
jgi:hypothetical protein